MPPFTLEGKSILITGASSGIGRGIAVACAEAGARCVLVARNQERLAAVREECGEGADHRVEQVDLSDPSQIQDLVVRLPQLDGAVLCAGISDKHTPLKFLSSECIDQILSVNVKAPIFLLVLSRGALDRCVNEEDWVRKEIFYAVECNRHIVPVVIVDDNFEGIPDCLPEGLKKAVGAHQFSELQMKTLFKASMDELVRYRIAPFVQKQEEQSGAEIHIETDAPCSLFRFNAFVKDLQPDIDNVVRLNPGTYKLTFRSTQFSDIEI